MALLLKSVLIWVVSATLVRLFVALGIGFLTYTGLEAAVSTALSYLAQWVGGMPESIYAIFARIGFFEALSIIGAAMLTSAAIKSVKVFVGLK